MPATTDELTDDAPVTTRRGRRFTAWPLWATVAGALGLFTLFSETRADSYGSDFAYPITAEDVASLSHSSFRLAGVTGYLTVLALLVFAALWRQRVERRYPGSLGAVLVTLGVVANSALVALRSGWRGALGNYLPGGSEADSYDAIGLYAYYMMNDFSPYIAWVPLLAAAFGLAWMGLREGLVSRGLGVLAGLLGIALLTATFLTGVPGLPGMSIIGLIVGGIWLAVGRSAAIRGSAG